MTIGAVNPDWDNNDVIINDEDDMEGDVKGVEGDVNLDDDNVEGAKCGVDIAGDWFVNCDVCECDVTNCRVCECDVVNCAVCEYDVRNCGVCEYDVRNCGVFVFDAND